MSRPLTCDGCDRRLTESDIPPLKLYVNSELPDEMKGKSREEIGGLMQLMQMMGQESPVKQEQLDFCSPLCLAKWAWAEGGLGKAAELWEESQRERC